MTEMNGQVPLQISVEPVRTHSAQAYEIANAITATLLNAEAGLSWLSAQPPDLEGVRRALNSIANDSKRAGEVVVRLQALMNECAQSG
jgi:hypothetical protein